MFDETLLEAQHLRKAYRQTLAVDDVSVRIAAGEHVTLIGPNGSGKTTLLKLLMGLEKADAGSIVRLPGMRMGYMPQKLSLSAAMPIRVRDFLSLNAQLSAEVLSMTRTESLLDRPMQGLSGGELQRVLLARALNGEPRLLVLDEPVQGMDMRGQSELYGLISQAREHLHCAVLMVSHDLHVVMAATDRVICLNRHVCCEGRPQQVSRTPQFIELFGDELAGRLAVYAHHHDHAHDAHGDVCRPETHA